MERDWSEYFKASLTKPLNPLWEKIDPLIKPGQDAIDLGCGVGSGTLHLLEKGLNVLAVDREAQALEILCGRLPDGANARLLQSSFQELELDPGSFDLAVAFFTLFFLPVEDFAAFWPRMTAALRTGGIFAGQLLGPNDDWAGEGCTGLQRTDVEKLLEPFEVLEFAEVEQDGETTLREPKHWHVFHIVARKR